MAAVPYSDTKKNYYNVNGFQFTQRATEGQQGAVMRKITKKDGSTKEVWEFLFKSLSGIITCIDVKDTDWGKQYEITLNDTDENMVLQMNVDSGYGDTFASRLPNVNPKQNVELIPYSFIPEGETRKKEGINIFQNGIKILPFFTKENPGDMPSVAKLQSAGVMSDPPESGDWKMFYGLIHKFLAANTMKLKEKFGTASDTGNTKADREDSEAAGYSANATGGSQKDDLPF